MPQLCWPPSRSPRAPAPGSHPTARSGTASPSEFARVAPTRLENASTPAYANPPASVQACRLVAWRYADRLAVAELRGLECDLRHAPCPHPGARQAGGEAGATRAPAPACGVAVERAGLGDRSLAGPRRLRGDRPG